MQSMTVAIAKTITADEAAMQSVAEAIRDAATTASEHASEHAARVRQSASEAGPKALETISRMVYTGPYVLAYGVVYATVFIAQSLPQENPVMHGFPRRRAGGHGRVRRGLSGRPDAILSVSRRRPNRFLTRNTSACKTGLTR
jgi:hypothetical protein